MVSSDYIFSGPWFLVIFISLLAGFVSFASPCIIPLVPGYLAYLASLQDKKDSPRQVIGAVLLFIGGFSLVFILLSATFLSFTANIGSHYNLRTLEIMGGIITIFLGIVFSGRIKFLQNDYKIFTPLQKASLWGAPLLGGVFALGWTPCVGPTLGSIMTLSVLEQDSNGFKALLYIVFYCLGLGLPFIFLATGSVYANRGVAFLRKHTRQIQLLGSLLLIIIGIALVTGYWDKFLIELKDWFPNNLMGI